MTDKRMTLELRELERWFSSHPQPELETASRDVLKASLREQLNDTGLRDSQAHQAAGDLNQRLKTAVRRKLAEQGSGLKILPLFSLRRPLPWFSSAAALVFVVFSFGLPDRNVQPLTDEPPKDYEPLTDSELASIKAELAYLELQSLANDFVFFGPGDVDGDLRDDIEHEFLPSLYLDSTDEFYHEGVSQ